MAQKADYYLDISTDVCPITFVKTKLLLERIEDGSLLEVRLCKGEPLQNVPRSVQEMGHRILSCEPEELGDNPEVFLLLIEKGALSSR